MTYYYNGNDIIPYFNSKTTKPYATVVTIAETGFMIVGTDISSTYLLLGSSSNIPVSTIFPTTNFFYKNGTDISTLYELDLVNYSGTQNTDYKIWPPGNHLGLLIQFLATTEISFNYTVDLLQFVMVGGGGGGGETSGSTNAGGGGGAGELITGYMQNIPANTDITITIGNGGNSDFSGNDTKIALGIYSITAIGGGEGGAGKNSSTSQVGSSTGGSGSYSNSQTFSGTATSRTISNTGYFITMSSYNNAGGKGQDQNNDSGAGGGGGGAIGAGGAGGTGGTSNAGGGNGGTGLKITYGSTDFYLAGGGGGGARRSDLTTDTAGGTNSYGGGTGGGDATGHVGLNGDANTGGGGGGGGNSATYDNTNNGGIGGSGTVIFYILPTGVST